MKINIVKQAFAFHETVRGHHHAQQNIPCQDYSDSFSDGKGKYSTIALADGHGAKECFRSSFGAKAAVEAAMQCMREFAEAIVVSEEMEHNFYDEFFSDTRCQRMKIRRLTDSIIVDWHERISEDYTQNPMSDLEAGIYAEKYGPNDDPAHIYGTTLLAGLLLPECMILLHQGDGRCEVIYEDGYVDQPVPWDSRCEYNVTTSLCDKDACSSIRSCVINLKEKRVIACYLGCDGIEDAYRDTYESFGGMHEVMGGVHTFYKDLTCQLASMSCDEFQEYLKNMLPEFSAVGRFSRCGSGDDVSVAGIVDLDAIESLKEKFSSDVKKYELEEALFDKEDKLRSKKRKHGILEKRMTEAKAKVDELYAELRKLEERQSDLEQKRNTMELEITHAEEEVDAFAAETEVFFSEEDRSIVERLLRTLGMTDQEAGDRIARGKEQKKGRHLKLCESFQKLEDAIREEQRVYRQIMDDIQEAEKVYKAAKENFDEYDAGYQEIESERQKIQEEIQHLEQKEDEEPPQDEVQILIED